MRIVHYLDGLDARRGGIVRAVRNMVQCQEHLLDVRLMVRRRQDDAADPADVGHHIVELGGSRLPGGTLTAGALRRARRVLDHADVLHLHTLWSPASAQLGAIAHRRGVGVVLSPHGALDPWPLRQKGGKKQVYLRSLGRVTLRNAVVLHATCEGEAASARAVLAGGRVEVVPLPLDAASYRRAQLATTAKITETPHDGAPGISVVFVGRMHEKKRVDRAVGALAALLARGRPATLTIVGTGAPTYEAYIRDLVHTSGLDPHVRILGFVSGEPRCRLVAAADVAIVPSEHENFGFVCFEALAVGTPLVTVPGVMTHRQLRDSGAAVVCDGSPEGLADAILRVVDGHAGGAMGPRGQRWILAVLDPARLARRFADLYRSARAPDRSFPALTG